MSIGIRRISERTALILVAILTVGLMIASLQFERHMGNQKLLFYQLQALRTSVNLFKAITKNNPKDLMELALSEYTFPGEVERHRYLEIPPMDREGKLIDPFGKPYVYDGSSGWVRSSSKGYEFW